MLSLFPPVTSMLTHFFAQMDACQQTLWEPSRFTKKSSPSPIVKHLLKGQTLAHEFLFQGFIFTA